MKIKFGEILRKKREELGFSLRQVAIKAGISHSYISEIEKNKFFKRETIELLIKALNIDSYTKKEILTNLDYSNTPSEVLKELNSLKENISKFEMGEIPVLSRIPLYDSLSAACGIIEGEILDFINIPLIENPKDCFAIKINKDSMEPTIPNGSIIIIKRKKEIPNGKIGVFIADANVTVKRIQRTKKEIILMNDNSVKYAPKVINRENPNFYEYGIVINVLVTL